MKATGILAALLLMVAGLQNVWAQRVVLHKTNGQTIECDVFELDSITFERGHEWVDLGLPSGTLWATCNIGANNPEEYGDYFAWGETKVKADYSWSTYKYSNELAGALTKYCTHSDYGFVDGKTELDPEDDAATANWGSDWQMPDKAQWEELLNKELITRTWTTRNNVNGYLFTSKSNDNSIFMPAGGGCAGTSLSNVGSDVYCWSRSLSTCMSISAYYYCDSYMHNGSRYCGLTVRPVRVQKQDSYADEKEKEYNAIQSFLNSDTVIRDADGDEVCNVGKITPISEDQFQAQGYTTDLSSNQYVLFANSGVYMQIVCEGVGEKLEEGKTARVISRFIEYNIMGDSIQLRNDVNYWHTTPDIMKVTNNLGIFSACFDTEANGGGAMYRAYGSANVPSGWLIPFPYIRIGRQETADEGIAKVRLIVPHSAGQADAASNVYPCFYEISFQKMRD